MGRGDDDSIRGRSLSGTVLSFELGLLWPTFMQYAGGIIGMPFSLEGFAFFTEAIFLGIDLYGWNRVPPVLHWLAGIVVAVSGVLSAVFVVLANAWMNAPAGFDVVNGQPTNIDPVAAMLNPASLHETIHMVLAAYVATAFLTAGIHAFFLLRSAKHLSPCFLQYCAGGCLHIDSAPDVERRFCRARSRQARAAKTRCDGSTLSNGYGRAPGDWRNSE